MSNCLPKYGTSNLLIYSLLYFKILLLGNTQSTGTEQNLYIGWLNLKYLAIKSNYFVVI